MKMQQSMTMLIWATNSVIKSKLNTNNRPRKYVYSMFTFQWCMEWVGKCTSWVQPGVFSHTKHPLGGTEPVIWRLLQSDPEIMLMSLPCFIDHINAAVSCRLHYIFVLYNFYLILMNPQTFSNILWTFCIPCLHSLIFFYCHSYVWMVWSAAFVGSLTVQIKRFSSFAT